MLGLLTAIFIIRLDESLPLFKKGMQTTLPGQTTITKLIGLMFYWRYSGFGRVVKTHWKIIVCS
jgi:hypothetical protein